MSKGKCSYMREKKLFVHKNDISCIARKAGEGGPGVRGGGGGKEGRNVGMRGAA